MGRYFVDAAIEKEHEVILFNRGRTNPDLYTDLKNIRGDRSQREDIKRLKELKFDAIVDTCGYFPDNLAMITEELKDQVGLYVFVSSCSVYDYNDRDSNKFDEDGTLVDLNIDKNDQGMETYGARKYLCEDVVIETFPKQHFVVRPGLIVGPHDPTYRFPYWVDRVAEGGVALAPGDPSAPLQFIDVRDLAEWMLLGVEKQLVGTYNAVSPHAQLTLGEFLQAVREEINLECEYQWLPEAFLKEHGVTCWSDLPLWVYQEIQGFLKVDSSKAMDAGLTYRPIHKTVRDTHEWSKWLYQEQYLDKVLTRDREAELIRAYRSTQ